MSKKNNVVSFPVQQPLTDPWCSSIVTPDGKTITGAAAREHRIKNAGGVNTLVLNAAIEAATNALRAASTPPVSAPVVNIAGKKK